MSNQNSKRMLGKYASIVGIVFSALVLLAACTESSVFKDYKDMPERTWHVDSAVYFSFQITDVSKPFQIDYNFRYTVDYPFRNLYITYYLEDSVGNVIMSDLQEIDFFKSKTGESLGSGLGDVFNLKVTGLSQIKLSNEGNYTFRLRQFMRRETLAGILSVGIEVKPNSGQ